MYELLLKDADLEPWAKPLRLEQTLITTSRNDLNNATHGLSYHVHASMHPNLMRLSAPINLQLAQKHYHSRFLELRELIMAEELKFKLVQWFTICISMMMFVLELS